MESERVYELQLTSVHGRIWDRQPTATQDGVLARVVNSQWNAQGHACPCAFEAVALSRDGRTCAAADLQGRLFLFYLQLNRYSLISSEGADLLANGLCFTQGRHEAVLLAVRRAVHVFDTETQQRVNVLSGHQHKVLTVSAAADKDLALTQSSDLTILWNTVDWSKHRSLHECGAAMH